jgi:hypothetical protein
MHAPGGTPCTRYGKASTSSNLGLFWHQEPQPRWDKDEGCHVGCEHSHEQPLCVSHLANHGGGFVLGMDGGPCLGRFRGPPTPPSPRSHHRRTPTGSVAAALPPFFFCFSHMCLWPEARIGQLADQVASAGWWGITGFSQALPGSQTPGPVTITEVKISSTRRHTVVSLGGRPCVFLSYISLPVKFSCLL